MPEIGAKHGPTHEDNGNDEISIAGLAGAVTIEDTPVDAHTTQGISSNWAYDHTNDPDAHGNTSHPWRIDLSVYASPKATTGINLFAGSSANMFGGYLYSNGAQNNLITWDVILAKGTWTIEIVHETYTDGGIISVQLDSVEKGTIDCYSGSEVKNIHSQITGIVMAATAIIELKLKMATKNGSSSGYQPYLQNITFIRTA